jgi:serine/threonine protein phosphatase PrpC
VIRRKRPPGEASSEAEGQPRGRHANKDEPTCRGSAAAELSNGSLDSSANEDQAIDRWAPIVVDQPIFEFEPKPPSATERYRADTIFDGWSTDLYTVRVASVRGYSHRYNGIPRQDEAAAVFEPESRAVVFAVADGVASARASHIGAAAACHTATQEISHQLVAGQAIDWDKVAAVAAHGLVASAVDLLGQDRPHPAAVEDLVATTLVAGCAIPTRRGTSISMIQIGDSGAWVLRGDRYFPVLDQKHDSGSPVISSAVSPLPRVPARLTVAEFELDADSVLLVGTDGFGDPLGDGDGQIGQLFAQHLARPPLPRALAHLLDFSRETFDDDRTLLAIWQRARRPSPSQGSAGG